MNEQTTAATIDPRWEPKFAILEKLAGGTDIHASIMKSVLIGVPPAGGQKLSFREVRTMICWPAFVFGFLWYFYQGMWKKALVLLACSLTLGTMVDLLIKDTLSYGIVIGLGYSFLVGQLATADYYRKVKQGFDGWW